MEQIETAPYSEMQRMRLRGLIVVSSEIISQYWPMRTFVHHNPLHSLENLHFEDAVRRGHQLLGGKGYLSNELFRGYVRSGRIRPHHIEAALKTLVHDKHVVLGARDISHFEVVRAHLLKGIMAPAGETLDAQINRRPDRTLIKTLADHLIPALNPPAFRESLEAGVDKEPAALGRRSTLAAWCDYTLGSQIMDQINGETIKWCEAFLDEGHASWPMPGRENGFYGAWKFLAEQEWSPCGITDNRQKIGGLPPSPEDALIEHLTALGIPSEVWQDYLSLHLATLPGWAGFIKWRADQTDYEWQHVYPVDLVQYLAVRVWYERELVQKVCRETLGIDGNFSAISADRQRRRSRKGRSSGHAPRRTAAWRLLALADALEIVPAILMETAPEELRVLLEWLDAFPESEHGPVWLKAFEAGYQEQLVGKLMSNVSNLQAAREDEKDGQRVVRHQAQVIFCLDVRSEPFRRHLEAVGDYDSFGIAGFFTVFIRYRALGSHHDTDQFPVIMKAKNAVREVPRTYQGQLLTRHQTRTKLLHTGHELLHDLKENVVTPYVAVESLGWFYSLPLIGKTVFADWYRKWTAWLRRIFVPPVATTLTVDKLLREEVEEMLAARKDLQRLIADLREAGLRNSRERCVRFPEVTAALTPAGAIREVRRRSCDWSQVRPEWGLSGNTTFIIGRRDLTRGLNLEGRVFLHSYDFREDSKGRLLEIVMTGPQVVGQWINMEHYFSTVDHEVYGSGSKIYHNVVGRFGIMSGPRSDLRTGLAWQTVMDGPRPYHEPMRLLTLIEAPRERIGQITRRHHLLQRLYDNEWVRLMALDPEEKIFYLYIPKKGWEPLREGIPIT